MNSSRDEKINIMSPSMRTLANSRAVEFACVQRRDAYHLIVLSCLVLYICIYRERYIHMICHICIDETCDSDSGVTSQARVS